MTGRRIAFWGSMPRLFHRSLYFCNPHNTKYLERGVLYSEDGSGIGPLWWREMRTEERKKGPVRSHRPESILISSSRRRGKLLQRERTFDAEYIVFIFTKWHFNNIIVGINLYRNQNKSFCLATATIERLGFDSRQGWSNFHLYSVRTIPGAHSVSCPIYTAEFSFAVYGTGQETYKLPPASSHVKNTWSYSSTPS
jgi:hypothetical protein